MFGEVDWSRIMQDLAGNDKELKISSKSNGKLFKESDVILFIF